MINMALQMMSNAWLTLYVSPFESATTLNHFEIGNGVLLAALLPSLFLSLDDTLQIGDKLKSRD